VTYNRIRPLKLQRQVAETHREVPRTKKKALPGTGHPAAVINEYFLHLCKKHIMSLQ